MRSRCLAGLRFVVSHPCARKKAQGWGTQLLWTRRVEEAGPSTALRSAQEGWQ
jgi:hypothetical protein